MKSKENYSKNSPFKDFIRAIFDINNKPQFTRRFFKNKSVITGYAHDKMGITDHFHKIHFNTKEGVVIETDPVTGERTKIPFTEEQKEQLKKTGTLE